MDGATKIVKGDATMSLIITMINFVGGTIIGMLLNGGTFSDVISRYSIVTIGDGLVSQLPALMISTATGMIVTRSVSEGSLNLDVVGQFKAQSRAITFQLPLALRDSETIASSSDRTSAKIRGTSVKRRPGV